MTAVQLRAAVDTDLDEILAHNNDAVPAVNELDRRDLEWFLEQAHTFLVAEAPVAEAPVAEAPVAEALRDAAGIAGFLIGLTGPGLDYASANYAWFGARYDRFVYVDRVVVAASGRGLGVGTALYDEFSRRGRADGHDVLLAEVNLVPRNDVSLAFHAARGFVSVGEQDTEGGTKRVTMLEKRLDG